jgi:hypothetical protein
MSRHFLGTLPLRSELRDHAPAHRSNPVALIEGVLLLRLLVSPSRRGGYRCRWRLLVYRRDRAANLSGLTRRREGSERCRPPRRSWCRR